MAHNTNSTMKDSPGWIVLARHAIVINVDGSRRITTYSKNGRIMQRIANCTPLTAVSAAMILRKRHGRDHPLLPILRPPRFAQPQHIALPSRQFGAENMKGPIGAKPSGKYPSTFRRECDHRRGFHLIQPIVGTVGGPNGRSVGIDQVDGLVAAGAQ